MPVDYSKWDKLELSDDEDFDCHPNVDKASMIRWKQAEIHRQRRERQDKIKALKLEKAMNERIVGALATLSPSSTSFSSPGAAASAAATLSKDMEEWDKTLANDVFVMAHSDRDARWAPPTPDPFFMKRVGIPKAAEDLRNAAGAVAVAIKTAGATAGNSSPEEVAALVEPLEKVRASFVEAFGKRNGEIDAEIRKEEEAIKAKLTSENMSEGFNKTIVAAKPKPSDEEEKATISKKTKKVVEKKTEIVTLNAPNQSEAAAAATSAAAAEPSATAGSSSASSSSTSTASTAATADDDEDEEVYITNPYVEEFSRLVKPEDSFKFIGQHPFILKAKYSDEILAEAFSLQMKGQPKQAKQCVHQSLMIQYCELLGKDGVSLFFQRLANPSHKAREQFMKDVNDTYTRIANRVKELKKQEEEKELEEKRQGEARVAAALQPDGSYKLPVEDEEDQRRSDVFDTLPRELQVALLKQDVDEINAFLATAGTDAEKYLKEAASVGLITLSDELQGE
ncbi:hypothetical protein DFJ73DRAFT_782874 [Zopfochytrium polystomum]|nr:hypothetical protein DFJ73DRAFT_782874 [Zopfochytrium polystomum]